VQPQQVGNGAISVVFFDHSEQSESEILVDEIEHIGEHMFFRSGSPTMRRLAGLRQNCSGR